MTKLNDDATNNEVDVEVVSMKDVALEEVKWLWFPYIPVGKAIIMYGNPGDGKTYACLKVAAQLSRGIPLPGEIRSTPINVLYLTAEDGIGDTIKPRLIAAGANEDRIFTIKDNGIPLTLTDSRIEAAVKKTKAKLLFIDPVQAFLGSNVDMNRANEVRVPLRHICDMAARNECSVVFIGHLNKCKGLDAIARGIGSMDFVAAVRGVLMVGRYKEDPNIRVIIQTKCSNGPEGESIAFRLDGENEFEWLDGYSDLTEYDLLNSGRVPKTKKKTKIITAVELLRSLIRNSEKAPLVTEIEAKVMAEGISKRTLDTAKAQMPELTSKKIGSVNYFFLDESKIPIYTPEELLEIEKESTT